MNQPQWLTFPQLPATWRPPATSSAPAVSRPSPAQPRAGYSLIEMLIVIAIVSVVFTLAAVIMHGLFRESSRLRDRLLYVEAVERFAAALRRDAQHAASATVLTPAAGGGPHLRLDFPSGGRIEFTVEQHGVRRTEYAAESVSEKGSDPLSSSSKGQTPFRTGSETVVRREAFALGPGVVIDWRTPAEVGPGELAARLRLPDRRRGDDAVTIIAALGSLPAVDRPEALPNSGGPRP